MPHRPNNRPNRLGLLGLLLVIPTPSFGDDGDPDPSFAEVGLVSWVHSQGGLPGVYSDVTVAALATSEDLVMGVGWHGDEHLNWRSFDAEGAAGGPRCRESSGTVFSPAIVGSRGLAALVDSTGNLLVGGELAVLGSEEQARSFVARFDIGAEGCVLDDSFSTNGWEFFDDEPFCATADCAVVALGEIRPPVVASPRIIALVRSVVVDGVIARYFLLGLNSSGGIDTSFSNDGWKEIETTALGVLAPEVAFEIDARGRINVAVSRYDPEGNFDLDVILLRYTSAGNLNTTIGDGGLVAIADEGTTGDDDDATARSLHFDADGRAIVGYDDGGSNFLVLDLGSGDLHWRAHASLVAPVVVAQGDDRLLTMHDFVSADGFRAYRWLVPESLDLVGDTSFGGGSTDYDVDLGDDDTDSVVDFVLWHGRPVVLGNARNEQFPLPHAVDGAFLMRLQNDYIFADGFDTGGRGRWSSSTP